MSTNQDPLNNNVKGRVLAGVGPTFVCTRGLSAVARPAAGRHRVNLTEAIPVAKMVVTVCRESTAHGSIAFQVIDANTIDVYTFDAAAAAADINFSIDVERVE